MTAAKKSKKTATNETFQMPENEEVRKKIEALLVEAEQVSKATEGIDLEAYPRYIISQASTHEREPGTVVSVSNPFEEVAGTIVRELAQDVYLIRVYDSELVVHEAHRAWV